METLQKTEVKIEELPINQQDNAQTHGINVYFPDLEKPITVNKGRENDLKLMRRLEPTAIAWAKELRE